MTGVGATPLSGAAGPRTEAFPTEAFPTEAFPTEAFPTEAIPTEAIPTEAIPTEAIPTEAIPTGAPEGAPLSLRAAVASLGAVEAGPLLPADQVARHFADHHAGVPATSAVRDEPSVRYRVDGSPMPVLVGPYGSEGRVRGWLPGLPARIDREAATALVAAAVPPVTVVDPPCQHTISAADLTSLPVLTATPRDAGPYITTGIVFAGDPATGETALSVHRMLVLDATRLAVWMIPGRALRRMHEEAGRLPVSVNIGAPPAVMVASALGTAFLPAGVDKLAMAGALAEAPVRVAAAVGQPTAVLADAEVVLEGYLDHTVADETPGVSLPEFLGYDGESRAGLAVLTVTAMTTREDPVFHAVIGPGREQSVILGLAGAVSVALSDTGRHGHLIHDLHFTAAGGGMLLLVIAVRKSSVDDDGALAGLAGGIFHQHGFVKLIVFTDPDVDIRAAEDVLWAVTTRANLGADTVTLPGFRPLPMDPAQSAAWAAEGRHGASGRSFIDATTPFALRGAVVRSFDRGGVE